MAKEPRVDHAPWREVHEALETYLPKARQVRTVCYGITLLGVIGAILGVLFPSKIAPLALLFVVLPRIIFAIWNQKNTPLCPGCDAPLGFDWRGSPRRLAGVYREKSCPSCGIPFVDSE